jgi:S-DNA-T family DNA segregation ATPase FtsK/SpoIIIE
LAAGFASCWPHGGTWPLPTGLGGVIGDALVRAPAVVFGPPGFIYNLALGIILGAATVATFFVAGGFGSRTDDEDLTAIEEDDDEPLGEDGDGGSISLGWAVHALMSTKARLAWLLSAAYRWLVSSAPAPRGLSFDRHEPSLGGRAAPSLAPQDDEEQDEEEEEEEPAARAPRKKAAPKSPARKSEKWDFPAISMLGAPKASDRQPLSKAELEANSRRLEVVLQDFGVRGEIVKANPGPVVTLYELEPAPGIKSSRVIGLADDIARSMSALGARRCRARPQRHRHRIANLASRESLPARAAHREGNQRIRCKASALSRQDHRWRSRHHRSRPHAAYADRRHHRLRQIGRHQHHDSQPRLSAAAGPVPADHGRSQDARTLGL